MIRATVSRLRASRRRPLSPSPGGASSFAVLAGVSLLTLLAPDGVSYRYADGPPCRTPYEPVLADLSE
jgi:hypothetical protein